MSTVPSSMLVCETLNARDNNELNNSSETLLEPATFRPSKTASDSSIMLQFPKQAHLITTPTLPAHWIENKIQ